MKNNQLKIDHFKRLKSLKTIQWNWDATLSNTYFQHIRTLNLSHSAYIVYIHFLNSRKVKKMEWKFRKISREKNCTCLISTKIIFCFTFFYYFCIHRPSHWKIPFNWFFFTSYLRILLYNAAYQSDSDLTKTRLL